MTTDRAAITDEIHAACCYQRDYDAEFVGIVGHLHVVLTGPDGEIKLDEIVDNLVTQIGDQYYGERAAGVASPPGSITGMQLGTGATAVAKTGAGAALVTLVPASLVALTGTPTSALNGETPPGRRISHAVTWAAGVATANGITEVVLVNQAVGTQTITPAANTIARALLNPVVNKGAADSLAVTWHHDIKGG